MLRVEHLCKSYAGRAVLTDISFHLAPGATLGLTGASGSGKTTLGRCLAGLERPTSGRVVFQGARVELQMIFQQPASSLNPHFTAAEIVEEPLVIAGSHPAAQRREEAAQALEATGIARTALHKFAHQFSGGERQRLAIARALVVRPKLLILDESFNGLDPEVAQQIAALLQDLRRSLGLAWILISHDLALIAGLADEIAVLERGRLVEHAPTAALLRTPREQATRELVDAARLLHPGAFPV